MPFGTDGHDILVEGALDDLDNEGRRGRTIGQIDARASWIDAARPDVVLMMIGANGAKGTPLPTAAGLISWQSHLGVTDIPDGGGADIVGGTGDETNVGDQITERANEGIDTIVAGRNWVLGANVENLVLTRTSSLTATGNGESNALSASAGDKVLGGAGGADPLVGMAGHDTCLVDDIGDVVGAIDRAPGRDARGALPVQRSRPRQQRHDRRLRSGRGQDRDPGLGLQRLPFARRA